MATKKGKKKDVTFTGARGHLRGNEPEKAGEEQERAFSDFIL